MNERRLGLAPGRLNEAMAEVAAVGRPEMREVVASGYTSELARTIARAPHGPDRAQLEGLLDGLLERSRGGSLTFGSWHGDWTPWNMACTRSGLLLWDWERFAQGVPVGFDVLHHRLQSAIVPGGDPPGEAASRLWRDAPVTLRTFAAGVEQARLTALLYLMELAARQLADGQAQAGARLGAVGTWLLPAIAEAVERS